MKITYEQELREDAIFEVVKKNDDGCKNSSKSQRDRQYRYCSA